MDKEKTRNLFLNNKEFVQIVYDILYGEKRNEIFEEYLLVFNNYKIIEDLDWDLYEDRIIVYREIESYLECLLELNYDFLVKDIGGLDYE